MVLNQSKATLSRELKNKKRPVSANRKKLYTSNTTNTLQSLLNRRVTKAQEISLNGNYGGINYGIDDQDENQNSIVQVNKKGSIDSNGSTNGSTENENEGEKRMSNYINGNLQKSNSIKNLNDIQQESLLTIKLDQRMSLTTDKDKDE